MTTTKTLKQLATAVKLTVTFGAKLPYDQQDDWQRQANGYRCTLRYKRRSYAFDFWMGSAHTEEPTAEGCLDCLLSDAQAGDESFEYFCDEFGYDSDSRKAEKTWKACQQTTKGMKRLLGNDYETFLYAER